MEWLHTYGSALIFVLALADGLNLPIPSTAVLLAAGGLVASGELNLAAVLLAAIAGVYLGNFPWYFLGRRMGPRVLLILCKVSLNASSCIGRMEAMYRKYGPASLVGARFIPGLAAIAPPLAGASGLSVRTYALYDFIGAVVFSVVMVLGGSVFGDFFKHPPSFGTVVKWLVWAAVAVLLYKIVMRLRMLYLSVPRMTADELHARLERGEKLVLLDARAVALRDQPDWKLPGAVYDVADGEKVTVVTYCECPFEASAAFIAKGLRRAGVKAYALKGGMESWKGSGYTCESV